MRKETLLAQEESRGESRMTSNGSLKVCGGQRKEKVRANFFKNPWNTEKIQKYMEEQIRVQYSDPTMTNPLGLPGYVPKPPEPSTLFDTSSPQIQ